MTNQKGQAGQFMHISITQLKAKLAVGLVSALLLTGLAGCGGRVVAARPAVPLAPVQPYSDVAKAVIIPQAPAVPMAAVRPLLLHLPGIGGKRSIDLAMTDGLVKGGFDGDIEIYDWTGTDTGLLALVASERNHRQAKQIADRLTERFDKDPIKPIYLTSHSGGGGIAIWALEDLPDRVKIKTLLLMSPALSPTYDLTKALRHVTGKVYVFSSMGDVLVLGTGCSMLGTIDGVKTDAAGMVGFSQPPAADPTQYAKLVPMPYQSAWVRYGNYGNHVGGMTYHFGQEILAPLVMSDRMPTAKVDTLSSSDQKKLQ